MQAEPEQQGAQGRQQRIIRHQRRGEEELRVEGDQHRRQQGQVRGDFMRPRLRQRPGRSPDTEDRHRAEQGRNPSRQVPRQHLPPPRPVFAAGPHERRRVAPPLPQEVRVGALLDVAFVGGEPEHRRERQPIGQRGLVALPRYVALLLWFALDGQPPLTSQEAHVVQVAWFVRPLAQGDGCIEEGGQEEIGQQQEQERKPAPPPTRTAR